MGGASIIIAFKYKLSKWMEVVSMIAFKFSL